MPWTGRQAAVLGAGPDFTALQFWSSARLGLGRTKARPQWHHRSAIKERLEAGELTSCVAGVCWGRHLRPLTEGLASSKRVETRLDEGLGQPGLRPIREEPTKEGEAKTLRRH